MSCPPCESSLARPKMSLPHSETMNIFSIYHFLYFSVPKRVFHLSRLGLGFKIRLISVTDFMKTRSFAVPLPCLQMTLHLQVGNFIYRLE